MPIHRVRFFAMPMGAPVGALIKLPEVACGLVSEMDVICENL